MNNGTRSDVFEPANGDFAIIGTDVREKLEYQLPSDTYAAFAEAFRDSVIGIVGVGTPEPDGRTGPGYSAGRTSHGDGRSRILAFADPDVASQVPGSQCNAGVPGAVLLQMAAGDPSCEGILVNSATEPISVIISKATASAIVQGPA